MKKLFLVAAWLVSVYGLPANSLRADELGSSVDRIFAKHKHHTGIYAVNIKTGKEIYSLNAKESFKPASVLKIITSAAALKHLGPEFRFKTRLFLSPDRKTLYVKGGGDPTLAIENAWLLAREVKKQKIKTLTEVVLDDTLFQDPSERTGIRAYNSGAGALSFNYNSISFEVCPAGLGQPALISIDPWESGIKTTGNIVTKAGDQSAFTVDELQVQRSFKLRGTIGKEAPCQVRYRSIEQPTAYFGRTFVELLKYLGIAVGRTRSGAVEGQMQPFYTNESRPLSLILYEMNHFSTNFIAEQVLYWVGTPQAEAPDAENRSLSRLSGLRQMGYYLQEIGVPKDQYSLADASGLSHEDRISALGIVRALIDMRKTTAVSAEFENGLSVAGASGTLKKRLTDISPAVLRGKTGTLDGVSSLAGYLTGSQGATIAFAVLQNNTDKETAQLREDRFISILAGELQ